MKKNYTEVRQEIAKSNPSGGMGYRAKCPRCGVTVDFIQYIGEDQCPVCNPCPIKETKTCSCSGTGGCGRCTPVKTGTPGDAGGAGAFKEVGNAG